ncbi:MAG: hypothetical protein E6J83_08365 [Deltaproteobacteria bacterium]|nr:MAG: hypothetical protein E6J83_08365 [Deltaproteobacteria bacterium]
MAVVAATLGTGATRAQAAGATAAAATVAAAPAPDNVRKAFADRFPNVVLKTHEGRNVRFYDDLLNGKIVLMNFMYASCTRR